MSASTATAPGSSAASLDARSAARPGGSSTSASGNSASRATSHATGSTAARSSTRQVALTTICWRPAPTDSDAPAAVELVGNGVGVVAGGAFVEHARRQRRGAGGTGGIRRTRPAFTPMASDTAGIRRFLAAMTVSPLGSTRRTRRERHQRAPPSEPLVGSKMPMVRLSARQVLRAPRRCTWSSVTASSRAFTVAPVLPAADGGEVAELVRQVGDAAAVEDEARPQLRPRPAPVRRR